MSSTAKKILRQQAKKEAGKRAANAAARREEVTRLIDSGKYADAVDLIAELVTDKVIDADLCCQLATCYFMTGDFDRAGTWIENTFHYDSAHLGSRMLLGRLCLMENKIEDAFKIFEYILEHYSGVLTEDDRITIEDSLFAYYRLEEDNIRANYPRLAKFMDISPAEEPAEEAPAPKNTQDDTNAAAEPEKSAEAEESKPKITVMSLDDIKKNISTAVSDSAKVIKDSLSDAVTLGKETAREKAGEVKESVREKVAEVKEQVSSIDSSSIKDTLAQLKARINAAAKPAEGSAPAAAPSPAADVSAAAGSPETPAEPVYAPDEETPATITGRNIALTAKLRLLNFFAGGHYVDGNNEKALDFLTAALAIDENDEATVKNLAIVKAARGDRDGALQLAAQLPTADLALLYIINHQ